MHKIFSVYSRTHSLARDLNLLFNLLRFYKFDKFVWWILSHIRSSLPYATFMRAHTHTLNAIVVHFIRYLFLLCVPPMRIQSAFNKTENNQCREKVRCQHRHLQWTQKQKFDWNCRWLTSRSCRSKHLRNSEAFPTIVSSMSCQCLTNYSAAFMRCMRKQCVSLCNWIAFYRANRRTLIVVWSLAAICSVQLQIKYPSQIGLPAPSPRAAIATDPKMRPVDLTTESTHFLYNFCVYAFSD